MAISKCLPVAIAFLVIAIAPNVAHAGGIPLGIVIEETPQGVVVRDVIPGGIADRCMPRLRPGAHIVTLEGLPVQSAAEFKRVIETSDFVRFEFADAKGEFRWARAWSRGHAPADCASCCTVAKSSLPAAIPVPPVAPGCAILSPSVFPQPRSSP